MTQVMSDAEIHRFCQNAEYPEIQKFALEPQAFLEGGKVMALKKIVERCLKEGKRMLLFSQVSMQRRAVSKGRSLIPSLS